MQEFKSLHDYEEAEFPDLIKRILLEQVTLFALISADEATYFIPEDGPEARRKAESGRYEIYKTAPVISELEKIHSSKIDSDPWVDSPLYKIRLSKYADDLWACRIPYRIKLKRFISPDGKRGVVGRGFGPSSTDPLDPLLIPFSRILVEDNPTKRKISEYEINTPEFATVLDVWEKYWADGKDGITKDALVKELVDDFGFTSVSARAIDRVCRPEHARLGRRSKTK